jgi:hypothetical protein
VTDEPTQIPASLHMPDELASGVYASMAAVWHTEHEFTLDFFVQATPGAVNDENGQTVIPYRGVARVRIPPSVIFEVARAIADNISRRDEALEARSGEGDQI